MDHPEGASRRIRWWMAGVAAAGACAGLAAFGWAWSAAFLGGSAVSWLNYRWLEKLVSSLGDAATGKSRPRARTAVFLGLRYLVLGGAAYAIVRYSTLNLTAALIGLFVAVAAVILEILFELIYAGT